MRIISRKKLRAFWTKHPDVEQPLKAWFADTKNTIWCNSMDIKKRYRNASFLGENRVVFNIKGNKYRLTTLIIIALLSYIFDLFSLIKNTTKLTLTLFNGAQI